MKKILSYSTVNKENEKIHPIIQALKSNNPQEIEKAYSTLFSIATNEQISAILNAPSKEIQDKEIQFLIKEYITQDYYLDEYSLLLNKLSEEQVGILQNETDIEKFKSMTIDILNQVNLEDEVFEELDKLILSASDKDLYAFITAKNEKDMMGALDIIVKKYNQKNKNMVTTFAVGEIAAGIKAAELVYAFGKAVVATASVAIAGYGVAKLSDASRQAARDR